MRCPVRPPPRRRRDVLARRAGDAAAPFPRVLLSGQPVGRRSPRRTSIAGCALTGTGDAAVRHRPVARRRGAGARGRRPRGDCMTGASICVPTGTPMLPRRRPAAGAGDVTQRRLPVPRRRARPHGGRRRRRPPARPDRAGAVHRAGRARDAARLRQRPARRSCSSRAGPSSPRPTQYLVQGALAAGARPPDRGRVGRGRGRIDGALVGHGRATSCCRTQSARRRAFRAGRRAVSVRLLRRAAPAGGQARPASSTGSSTSRSRDSEEPTAGAAPAHALRPAAAGPAPALTAGQRRASTAASGSRRSTSSGPRRPTALPAGEDAGARRRARRPGHVLRRPHRRRAATSRATRFASSPGAGERRAAGRLRPAARRGRVLVQGRVPDRLRLRAAVHVPARGAPTRRRSTTSPRTTRSFRRLMLDRLSLLAPEWTERARRPTSAWRSSSCSPTSPTSSRTARTRSRPRPTSTRRARRVSLRRHARLVDYRCTRAATRARGCGSSSAARASRSPRGTTLLTRVPGRARRDRARRPPSTARRSRPAPRSSRPSTTAVLYATSRALRLLDLGRRRAAACRAARPPRRSSATTRSCRPATCSCSPRSPGPITGQRRGRRPGEARRRPADAASCASSDPSGGLFDDPPTNAAVAVTEIAWDEADALPFPLCVSVEERPDLVVGEAWGNIVLADHGRTIAGEALGDVPAPVLTAVARRRLRPVRARRPEPCRSASGRRSRTRPLTQARRGAAAVAVAEGPLDRGAAPPSSRSRTFGAGSARLASTTRGFRFTDGSAVVRGGDDALVGERRRHRRAGCCVERPGRCRCSRGRAGGGATLAADPRAARPASALDGHARLGATEPWTPAARPARQRRRRARVRRRGRARRHRDAPLRRRRARPPAGRPARRSTPTYRVGNGVAGNVGAGRARARRDANGAIVAGRRTRCAAAGGVDPEPATRSAATRRRRSSSRSARSPRRTTPR